MIQQSGDKNGFPTLLWFLFSLPQTRITQLFGDRERAESGFPETGLRVRGGWCAKENGLTMSPMVIPLVRLENGLTMSHVVRCMVRLWLLNFLGFLKNTCTKLDKVFFKFSKE